MLALLLIGCGDGGGVGGALDVAERALGDARAGVAQIRVGGTRLRTRTGSTTWNGTDLVGWLAPCGVETGATVEASLVLRPGTWPHEVLDVEGAGDAAEDCVEERLSRFPFEEPAGHDEVDVVVARVPMSGAGAGERAVLRGGSTLSMAPPSAWVADQPDAIDLDTLRIDDGAPRWRRGGGRVTAEALRRPEELARVLACADGAPGLVRTVLVFADGGLEEVQTSPRSDCVEVQARAFQGVVARNEVAGRPLSAWSRAVVVVDVPVGPW